jgi:Protein of unknown function (DUF2934)
MAVGQLPESNNRYAGLNRLSPADSKRRIIDREPISVQPPPTTPEHHQAVQLAAYYFWQARGCPIGSPNVDWFRAEEQLNQLTEETQAPPAMLAVAAAVGSALGSVAGFVSSVAGLAAPAERPPSE